jgi:hypothetical protein
MPALPPTTGSPLNLYVPPFGYGTGPNDFTWDVPANDNWNILNSFAETVVLYSPTVSQTIVQPASTYLNINSLQAYGATPVIRFGVAASVWDTALSRTAAGTLSVDTTTVGNSAGTLKANVVNAVVGFQNNGAAPSGHVLVGNGTSYVDSATIPSGAANYQIIEQYGTPITQRNKLNFLAPLTAVDDSGNGSSDVGLAASGVTAGSYVAPTITVDTFGRITAAVASSLSRVTNSNGSYIQFPDGTLMQWGTAASTSGSGYRTITFPKPFTTAVQTILTSVEQTTGNIVATPQSGTATLTQFVAIINGLVFVGGSGGNPTGSEIVQWFAMGY